MAVRDDPEAGRLRVQLYRKMTPQERIELAAQMFERAPALVRDSIRQCSPDISPEELERRVRRRMLPRGLPDPAETSRLG